MNASLGMSTNELYREQGYVLLKGAVCPESIDLLLSRYLSLTEELTGRRFEDSLGADLVEFFDQNREVESEVYNRIRDKPWLEEFSKQPGIVRPVKRILGPECGLFQKIPFRMDMPKWLHELAFWHQDYFYVRGNPEIVTAWIPMHDVSYLNGCLSVMPRSHLSGLVEHDLKIGKKNVPSGIFGEEIRMVEMKKGDLLLFSAFMLHSSNLNLSPSIRYSVQARFTALDKPLDRSMGGTVRI